MNQDSDERNADSKVPGQKKVFMSPPTKSTNLPKFPQVNNPILLEFVKTSLHRKVDQHVGYLTDSTPNSFHSLEIKALEQKMDPLFV